MSTATRPAGAGAASDGAASEIMLEVRRMTSGLSRTAAVAIIVGWAVLIAAIVVAGPGGALADSIVSIGILGTAAVGYDIVIGISGQLYLGMNGVIAASAYAAGLFALHVTADPAAGLVLGIGTGAAAAAASGLVVMRLSEFNYAIVTLAFGSLVIAGSIAWQSVTGGATGIGPVPGMLGGNIVVPDYRTWIIFSGSILGVAMLGSLILKKSAIGRTWQVVARDRRLAHAFGVNTARYRLYALVYGGALAGATGFMMARYTQFLSPDAFSTTLALELVLIVFLGGRGSIWGAILGTAIVYGITRFLSSEGDYSQVVLGAIFIIVLTVAPLGLALRIEWIAKKVPRRWRVR